MPEGYPFWHRPLFARSLANFVLPDTVIHANPHGPSETTHSCPIPETTMAFGWIACPASIPAASAILCNVIESIFFLRDWQFCGDLPTPLVILASPTLAGAERFAPLETLVSGCYPDSTHPGSCLEMPNNRQSPRQIGREPRGTTPLRLRPVGIG